MKLIDLLCVVHPSEMIDFEYYNKSIGEACCFGNGLVKCAHLLASPDSVLDNMEVDECFVDDQLGFGPHLCIYCVSEKTPVNTFRYFKHYGLYDF